VETLLFFKIIKLFAEEAVLVAWGSSAKPTIERIMLPPLSAAPSSIDIKCQTVSKPQPAHLSCLALQPSVHGLNHPSTPIEQLPAKAIGHARERNYQIQTALPYQPAHVFTMLASVAVCLPESISLKSALTKLFFNEVVVCFGMDGLFITYPADVVPNLAQMQCFRQRESYSQVSTKAG